MQLDTLKDYQIISTFLAVGLLLSGAFLFGKIFEKMKAPKVVGEILGGMIFGSSLLYNFFPEMVKGIFCSYPEEGKVLNVFYQLGLIFLMFSSGFNTKLEAKKRDAKTLVLLLVGTTVIPLAMAIPFAGRFERQFIGAADNHLSYLIVFMISVAITSIPVISKIFFDMDIMNTDFANMVLTVATFQDLCLWILLNVALNSAESQETDFKSLLITICITLFLFIMVTIAAEKIRSININIKPEVFFTISFIFLFIMIAALSELHINMMYSAFLVGYIIKALCETNQQMSKMMESLKDISFALFIPVYFALVGIQIDILHNFSFRRFCVYFVIAFFLEAFGTVIMLLFSKLRKKTIINFAITMNARGGPGIVLATTAYAYRIINVEFFTVIILTTLLSSTIAGYWLRWEQKKEQDVFMKLYK